MRNLYIEFQNTIREGLQMKKLARLRKAKVLAGELRIHQEGMVADHQVIEMLEQQFVYLFICEGRTDSLEWCKIAQKQGKDGNSALILVNQKLTESDRVIAALCGVYWYLTCGIETGEHLFVLDNSEKNKEFCFEAMCFAAHYLLPELCIWKELYQTSQKEIKGREEIITYLVSKYRIPEAIVRYRIKEAFSEITICK